MYDRTLLRGPPQPVTRTLLLDSSETLWKPLFIWVSFESHSVCLPSVSISLVRFWREGKRNKWEALSSWEMLVLSFLSRGWISHSNAKIIPERPNLVKCGRMFENSLSGKGYSVSRFRFISIGSTDRKLLSVALIVGQIRPDKELRHPNGTNFFLV